MPIIEKPNPNVGPGPAEGEPLDGFDTKFPYQMVPLGGTREMGVRTGDFPAELKLDNPAIASLTNFRIQSPSGAQFPLPPVGSILVPARSVVHFTIKGNGIGFAKITGQDLPTGRAPLKPDFNLAISVKRKEKRNFALCYLFDHVNFDVGARRNFPAHFEEINKIFEPQSNFQIVNVDGPVAGTARARQLQIKGSMRKFFNLDNDPLVNRVVDAYDKKFHDDSQNVHGVVFVVPVPLRHTNKKQVADVATVAENQRFRHRGKKFNIMFVGPQDPPRKPIKEGGRPSRVRLLRHTMAHEIGHSLGCKHHPDFGALASITGTLINLIAEFNLNFFFQPDTRNLMFPTLDIPSNRISAEQIEQMHLVGPTFPDGEV